MKTIVVLGAGMVGKAIAIDLSDRYRVIAADVDLNSLNFLKANYPIETVGINLMEEDDLKQLVQNCDLVVSAVPGFMGYQTLKSVIEVGKSVVDISFMPEDFMDLNSLAAKNGITALTDCGVAPGMPNLFAGYYNELMEIENFEYCVGGLPKVKVYPFYYKAPFSPIDVIEEYTRPARYVEKGQLLVKPALSDPELLHFDNVGTLEAFNTDGLRSLISNLPHIPNMKEKTLRYPGHIALISALKAAGFFEKSPLTVNNTAIRPIDFTSKVLINDWKLPTQEPEFTVMRIEITGRQDGIAKKVSYNLYDEYDDATQLSSMGRTTGFTATACAEMVLQGRFFAKGVFPLELVGMDADNAEFILDYQAQRGIHYQKTVQVL